MNKWLLSMLVLFDIGLVLLLIGIIIVMTV
jgi:hypothetical protein